jgi:hypothetical protein
LTALPARQTGAPLKTRAFAEVARGSADRSEQTAQDARESAMPCRCSLYFVLGIGHRSQFDVHKRGA